MDKKKTLIIIAVLFLLYIFYSLFYGLENQSKNNAKASGGEEPLYKTNFPKNKDILVEIIQEDPIPAEVIEQLAPAPEPISEIIQEDPISQRRNPNNYGHGESNFLAICYTQFVNCRARDVMFNYPSEQYPWSEEAEMREVECITFSKYCLNENFQTITPEDELKIFNQYQQEKVENRDQNDYQQ